MYTAISLEFVNFFKIKFALSISLFRLIYKYGTKSHDHAAIMRHCGRSSKNLHLFLEQQIHFIYSNAIDSGERSSLSFAQLIAILEMFDIYMLR